jgi:hypothetical protein
MWARRTPRKASFRFNFLLLLILSDLLFQTPAGIGLEPSWDAILSPPVDCVYKIRGLWRLSQKEQLALCSGAESDAPIRCLVMSSLDDLNLQQRIALCQGAASDAPARCALAALHRGLTGDQRVKLCGGALSTNPDLCFDASASFLSLSFDQRILLCANSKTDETLRCYDNASVLNLTGDQRVRLCTAIVSSAAGS